MCSSKQHRELSGYELRTAKWNARWAMWKTIAVVAGLAAYVVDRILARWP
jgi:hypothetical protein